MSQHKSVLEFLATIGFTLPMTVEEYSQEKKATIVCPKNHSKSLAKTSLQNKISMFRRGEVSQFCSECASERDQKESEEKYVQTIEEKTGHKVLEVDAQTRKVVYQCGNCGVVGNTTTSNLMTNKGGCKSCEYTQMKLPYEELTQKVEETGARLLTLQGEYTNNKMLLSIICSCGNPDMKTLSDIRKGKKCKVNCARK